MTPRILVTVGGRTALPVLAGLTRLPLDVRAATSDALAHHTGSFPANRRVPLSDAASGEEILELARELDVDAVIPTGDVDLRAVAELAWVFDLRGVAVSAPAIWTLEACADPAALARAWPAHPATRAPDGAAGPADTWWDLIVDRDGGLRWASTRGAVAGPDTLGRVGAAARALGLRYAASLLTRAHADGRSELVRVVPRFTPALGPVVARGVNVPRILLELLLRRGLPRVSAGAPSIWAPAAEGLALHA